MMKMVVINKSENIEVSGKDFKSTEPITAYSEMFFEQRAVAGIEGAFYVRAGRNEHNAYFHLSMPFEEDTGVHVEFKKPSLSPPLYHAYSVEVFIDDVKGIQGEIEALRQALLFAAEKLKTE